MTSPSYPTLFRSVLPAEYMDNNSNVFFLIFLQLITRFRIVHQSTYEPSHRLTQHQPYIVAILPLPSTAVRRITYHRETVYFLSRVRIHVSSLILKASTGTQREVTATSTDTQREVTATSTGT
jgi:hypothetical protein